jgi:hypothetical protein
MSTAFIRNIHIIYVILNHLDQIYTTIQMDLGVVDLSDDEQEELAGDQLEIERIKAEILKLENEAKHARKELEVKDIERASQLLLANAGDLLLKAETQSQT